MTVEPPHKDIYRFEGRVSWNNNAMVESASVENTLWMNTILASQGSVIALVLYTGAATRAVMNTSYPSTKMGLLDLEINSISKVIHIRSHRLDIGILYSFSIYYYGCS